MIIHPDIYTTPDMPTIRFKEPKENIDLDLELPKILHTQGWGCGTYFHIQFISHDKTKLLSQALYVVSEEKETLHTNEANPYQPITKTIFRRKAECVGKWQNFGTVETFDDEKVKVDGPVIKWNPGKKLHQLMLNNEVIYENSDKKEVEKVAEAGG